VFVVDEVKNIILLVDTPNRATARENHFSSKMTIGTTANTTPVCIVRVEVQIRRANPTRRKQDHFWGLHIASLLFNF